MEKIYYNGKIITMKNENDIYDTILTENGIIKAVGSFSEISLLAKNNAEKINLNGKTMLPAFIDSHGHLSMLAMNIEKANLSSAENFDDIVRILSDFRKKHKLFHGEYILGYGYDDNFLKEKKHPDKFLLDRVSKENPVFITHISMHMGVGNSLALKRAGITTSSDVSSDFVGRFSDGECTGFLAETGMSPVFMQILNLPQNYNKLYKQAQDEYLKNGISTIQDGALSETQFNQLKVLADNNILKVDTVGYVMLTDNAHKIYVDNKNLAEKYINHLKFGGYKLVLDGSPQGKTAWLSKPYSDGTNGNAWMTDNDVIFYTRQAVDDGVQLLAHCNGDNASEQFLNCYEKAFKESENKNKTSLRPVMIHCQTVRKDQLERFKKINMIPSFFVDHVFRWGDVHRKNLGPDRAENISPVGWAEKTGLKYTFHQDTPILQPDMLKTIETAVCRKTLSGYELGKKQKISVYNSIKAVTLNAAFQYGEEHKKGSLEVGKNADFVLLDKNPFEVNVDEISKIKVIETIINDKKEFEL